MSEGNEKSTATKNTAYGPEISQGNGSGAGGNKHSTTFNEVSCYLLAPIEQVSNSTTGSDKKQFLGRGLICSQICMYIFLCNRV